jgi:hypothetical protein
MTFKYDIAKSGCPIDCKYCVITKVDSRRSLWNRHTIIGINKAVTILNPPPDTNDDEAMKEFYNFPLDLFTGDYVGFNAISDPFWGIYEKELLYFLENVSPLAKLVTCVTKFPIQDKIFEKLAQYKNFRLIVSITGLDTLEKSNTESRLLNLKKAKEYGIKAFPICHPYIAGMTDLSFLKQLKLLGYNEIDVKGLRYNHQNMHHWMPTSSQKYYQHTQEKEILPEDGWRDKLSQQGIVLRSLKNWYRQDNLSPKLSIEDATNKVRKILQYANITSSDTDDAVIQEAITRRL